MTAHDADEVIRKVFAHRTLNDEEMAALRAIAVRVATSTAAAHLCAREHATLRSNARLRGALADLAAARDDIARGSEAHALGCIHSAANAIRAEIAALTDGAA